MNRSLLACFCMQKCWWLLTVIFLHIGIIAVIVEKLEAEICRCCDFQQLSGILGEEEVVQSTNVCEWSTTLISLSHVASHMC